MSISKNRLEEQTKSMKAIIIPLISIILGLFMVLFDGTAVNVALPKLSTAFDSPLSLLQWTVTGYVLAHAAVIPLSGWLSDRFGAKQIFLFSIAFFTLGSILVAISTTAEQMILFRVIQGIGGGMIMPISIAFVYKVSPPEKVGTVMGVMGIPVLLAPALAPLLAGWLVDYVTWQWIFIINIPIGIIAIILGIRSLPNIKGEPSTSLDIWGILLAPIAFASLSYGISEGTNGWTSSRTLWGLLIGVIALFMFIWVELRQEQPILELRVFKSLKFNISIYIQWIFQIALFGTMFMVPLFLQEVHQYSALKTGLLMLPQATASGIFVLISGRLFDRLGARPLVMSGMAAIGGAAFLLSHVSVSGEMTMLILALFLLGSGMGLAMMPLTTHIIQLAPSHLVDRVTALTSAAQQFISSFAIAGLMTILTSQMKHFTSVEGLSSLDTMANSFSATFKALIYVSVIGLLLSMLLVKSQMGAADKNGQETLHTRNMMH
ncbi:DHA2 family efflux MFS transporter permease subunit [Paenibacillus crassostreae]|uniref:MFS transporter n=2 Tax=Paenibacillus crassostreae TaxID=1763538 RepID=A0A167AV78_9BACL|nr:DHA2 family efflux MFS transporter permease subunit [Paenibacillus crassostreae]OAB71470.1 MFS transporter [Paenibacillus crassostreae]